MTTINHVIKCHRAAVVIASREHSFHDFLYIILISFLQDKSILCLGLLKTIMSVRPPLFIRGLDCLKITEGRGLRCSCENVGGRGDCK